MSDWDNLYTPPPAEPTPLLMGPFGVRKLVVSVLQDRLPEIYAKLAHQYGSRYEAWEPPKKFYDYEVVRLLPEEFPVVVVSTPNTGSLIPDSIDLVTGDPVFRSEYPVRVFHWVRASGHEEAIKTRDFQAMAVRIALTTKGLHAGGTCLDSESMATVLYETFREEYSEVVAHTNNAFIAGSYTSFTVTATERASATVLADLATSPSGGWDFRIETRGTEGDDRSDFDL